MKLPQPNERYLWKTHIIVNGERLKIFCLDQEHTISTQRCSGSSSQGEWQQNKTNKKHKQQTNKQNHPNWNGRNQTLYLQLTSSYT